MDEPTITPLSHGNNYEAYIDEIMSACERSLSIRESSVSFRKILNGSSKDDLMEWIEQYSQMPYQKIKSFVNGIVKDIKSVKNAIEYPWTNGTVEGVVNRIKVKKREMYGRAHFELLRRKVCLSISG